MVIIYLLIIINGIYAQSVTNGLNMLSYTTRGLYVLSPEKYGYAESFIIEMWSAGGGAGNPCGEYGRGGGGGSYMKASVNSGQLSFNITIGSGGNGGTGYYTKYSSSVTCLGSNGNDGGSTFIQSDDANGTIYLSIGGGLSGDNGGVGNIFYQATGTENYFVSYGENQYEMDKPGIGTLNHGGDAAFGGKGGNYYYGTFSHYNYYYNFGRSGYQPGGGGLGLLCTTVTPLSNNTSYGGSGADGAVLIYFIPKEQQEIVQSNNETIIIYQGNPPIQLVIIYLTIIVIILFIVVFVLSYLVCYIFVHMRQLDRRMQEIYF